MTRKPTHPGIVFFEDVLVPLGLSITAAAGLLGVSRKALSELVNGRVSLSPEMALRIACATGTSAESWMNMQLSLTFWKERQRELQGVVSASMVPV